MKHNTIQKALFVCINTSTAILFKVTLYIAMQRHCQNSREGLITAVCIKSVLKMSLLLVSYMKMDMDWFNRCLEYALWSFLCILTWYLLCLFQGIFWEQLNTDKQQSRSTMELQYLFSLLDKSGNQSASSNPRWRTLADKIAAPFSLKNPLVHPTNLEILWHYLALTWCHVSMNWYSGVWLVLVLQLSG